MNKEKTYDGGLFIFMFGLILIIIALFTTANAQSLLPMTVVRNYAELITALKPYADVYIPDGIKISLPRFTKLPHGVYLHGSGTWRKGTDVGMLYSDSMYPDTSNTSMIITGGDNVTIEGLIIKGSQVDILDYDLFRGWGCGIKALHKNLKVINCEVYGWSKFGIWFFHQDSSLADLGYIHHCRGQSYGYGVWMGGKGDQEGKHSTVQNCVFEANRICTDSHGGKNSWTFKNNCVMKSSLYYNVQRHYSSNGLGGINTYIDSNVFHSTQINVNLPFPHPGGKAYVRNNWFTRSFTDSSAPAVRVELIPTHQINDPRIVLSGNKFSSIDMPVPVASITASVDSGRAPLTVTFQTPAQDSAWYLWRFADGDFRGNEKRERNPKYTFRYPGEYLVKLYVIKNNISSVAAVKKIIVTDTVPTLSASIKDSYNGKLFGYYKIEIRVDSTDLIYQDDVMATTTGWRKIVKNMSKYKDGKTHRLAIRLYCKKPVTAAKEIPELFVWSDQISINGSTLYNGDFETSQLYPPWNLKFNTICVPYQGVSTQITTAEARSGEHSFLLRIPYGGITCTGLWAEVYQYFTIK